MRKSIVGLVAVAAFIVGIALLEGVGQGATRPQTTCPVTGQAIDPKTSPHVDWQGQRIYFASAAAADQFRRDPDVVFAKLEADHVRLENIEANCPVSGEALAGAAGAGPVISYKGRTIRFCCPDCPPKFEVNPARYLDKLPGEQVASR